MKRQGTDHRRAFAGLLAAALAATTAACTPGPTSAETREATRTQDHVESIGIKTASATCDREAKHRFACSITTPDDITIEMTVTNRSGNGQPQYETTRGLIDGDATARQLQLQLGHRLQTNVTVNCPAIVTANTGDTFTCTAKPENTKATRNLRVTILNDRTGDFTFTSRR